MKVILLQDVAKIGRRGEVAEVSNGYALNQLIPKKKAELATPVNLKKISKLQADRESNVANTGVAFKAAIKILKSEPLVITAEMNEQDHTFQAVSATDIVAAAEEKKITIAADMVEFTKPIKAAGEHEVTLSAGDNTAAFTINVVKK